jgi:hypothetical protein
MDRVSTPMMCSTDPSVQPIRQAFVADGLGILRENPMIRYALRQVVDSHIAEAILGGVLILGLAMNGDLSNIASFGVEVIHAFATILQFAVGLFVGPYLAEILVAISGGVALLIYHRWNSRQTLRNLSSLPTG